MNQPTEHLDQNELVLWIQNKFGHLRPYVGNILFGLALLVVLIAALMFYLQSRRELYASQWQALNLALTQFRMDGQSDRFTEIADQFPNETPSLWALQMAGDAEMQSGLANMITQRPEAMRQLEKAKKNYQRILDATIEKPAMLMQRTLFSLAYCHESLGEFEEARKLYRRILDEAPDSIFQASVQRALNRLDNPEFVAFYDTFKTVGVAPGSKLPARPDISFPDIE